MLNILIVDDSVVLTRKLTVILTGLGHNVVGSAKDGLQAIDLAKKLKPDLITMDIVMPNMAGIEATKKIKEFDKKVVIIMVSANKQVEDIANSLKSGAMGYILKPFTIDKINEEIDSIFYKDSDKQNEHEYEDEDEKGINIKVLDTIAVEAKTFLSEYADADYKTIATIRNHSSELRLNDYAAAIYVFGKINFTVILSLKESLLEKISATFLSGEKVLENEKRVIYNSVVKETLNTIIGLSLSSFTKKGQCLNITPPTQANNTNIKKYDNKRRFSEDLITRFGKLSISVIDYNIKEI